MLDLLIRIANLPAAEAALAAYITLDDQGKKVLRLPQWCDALGYNEPFAAYTDLGSPPVMSADGQTVVTPGVPPTAAAGNWFLVSFDKRSPPAQLAPVIMAQSDRSAPMQLPAGIKGLSTMWAGMLAPIPG